MAAVQIQPSTLKEMRDTQIALRAFNKALLRSLDRESDRMVGIVEQYEQREAELIDDSNTRNKIIMWFALIMLVMLITIFALCIIVAGKVII